MTRNTILGGLGLCFLAYGLYTFWTPLFWITLGVGLMGYAGFRWMTDDIKPRKRTP